MKKNGQVSRKGLITKMVKNLGVLKSNKKSEKNSLTGDIKQAMGELENIRKIFDFADDPEIIEYAIFAEKAAIMRLTYLIKKAKINEDSLEVSNSYLK